ncbi:MULTISPECIES: CaiB/BaiF CoA transferase family protein [Polaromonas]|uniref:CaiB/BaiF CoA transferase family protein n=1 Tax=Polaromonas aquatica TaxID=332657 RepID=A0ABW1U1Q1_9BURK
MQAKDNEPLLAGLRVLDLSQGIAGPYCGAILQQQGAEVIKVEPPGGDWARNMGIERDGFSAVVLAYNAGKSGLCVDAGVDAGRAVLQRVAQQVDIVIQNFRPGVVDRLGIGYETLASLNERLVYVSISGFGPDGPFADMPATDNVLQAMSGMMHANRGATGVPQKVGLYLADIAAAVYASQLACAALYRRSITGRGRHIQLSLLEACAAIQSSNILDAVFSSGLSPARSATAPGGVFRVSDGFITLATLNNGMFTRLCNVIGATHLLQDERFGSNQSRLAHAELLNEQVAVQLRGECLAHWLPGLKAADILHAAVGNYQDLLANTQVSHAGIFGEVRNAGLAALPRARHPGCPRSAAAESAPRIGEHTAKVLAGFGFTAREVGELVASRVVRVSEHAGK